MEKCLLCGLYDDACPCHYNHKSKAEIWCEKIDELRTDNAAKDETIERLTEALERIAHIGNPCTSDCAWTARKVLNPELAKALRAG